MAIVSNYISDGEIDFYGLFYDFTDEFEQHVDDFYSQVDLTGRMVVYDFDWYIDDTFVSVHYIIDFGDYSFDGEQLKGKVNVDVQVEVSTYDDGVVPRDKIAENNHVNIWHEVEVELDNRGLPFNVIYRDDLERQLPVVGADWDLGHFASRMWSFVRQINDDYNVLAQRMTDDLK